MKYLIVAAHPDDEVLGAGASIRKWSKSGNVVDLCIMCADAGARLFRPESKVLNDEMREASAAVGISRRFEAHFPNIEMNTIPHIELVKHIENAIIESGPDIVITHHPSDLNNDHMQTSLACQEAFRIFQRRPEIKAIKELWYMEIPSCTEWSLNSAVSRFVPNTFVEIGEDGVKEKIKALAMYQGVMRPYPHPRSEESLQGLAAFRGSQSGCSYAEAFETAIRIITQ